MKMDITGRHIEITEPIRKFAEDRLQRLHSVLEEVVEVHFILTIEKHQRHIAEVNVKTHHDFYNSEEVSTDMYTSIAAVLDNMEKQILRSKGKSLARKRRANHAGGVVTSSAEEIEAAIGDTLPRIVRTHEIAAKPLSVDEAALEVDTNGSMFLVFRNSETRRLNVVYKRKDGNIGWIEPEA
jgi:putative sigma-54 modulation protein